MEQVTAKLATIRAQIEQISQIPLTEHGTTFNEIHRELSETLTAIEGL